MKTINKIILSVGAVAMLFASCSEDAVRTPSPAFNEKSMQVYFDSAQNQSSFEVAPEVMEIPLVLTRKVTAEKAIVPLTLEGSSMLSISGDITFEAGVAQDTVWVKLDKAIEPFKNYSASITIADDFTNPYLEGESGSQTFYVNVVKNDWADYAYGTYMSNFFGSDAGAATWEQVMQYSKILDLYRLPDCYEIGYAIQFTLDEEGAVTPVADEIATGYVHPSYGMVNIVIAPETSSLNKEEKVLFFDAEFVVSAGSFGPAGEGLIISEFVE